MSFIEDVKSSASGKWTATKDVNQVLDASQANSSSKKEEIYGRIVKASLLKIIKGDNQWQDFV